MDTCPECRTDEFLLVCEECNRTVCIECEPDLIHPCEHGGIWHCEDCLEEHYRECRECAWGLSESEQADSRPEKDYL